MSFFLPAATAIAQQVADMDRAVRFYERLGLPRSSLRGRDGEVYFLLDTMVLVLLPTYLPGEAPKPGDPVLGFSNGGTCPIQYYSSPARVDAALAVARLAGGQGAVLIHSAAEKYRTAYVTDPDGNPWQLRYDGAIRVNNGHIRLPA